MKQIDCLVGEIVCSGVSEFFINTCERYGSVGPPSTPLTKLYSEQTVLLSRSPCFRKVCAYVVQINVTIASM